jgi:hypothetical protein
MVEHVINVPEPMREEAQLQEEGPLNWFGKKWVAFLHSLALSSCIVCLFPLVKSMKKD